MRIIFSLICIMMMLSLSGIAFAQAQEEPGEWEDLPSVNGIGSPDFFRGPVAILWTFQGDNEEGSSRSYALEARYGIMSGQILPNFFGQLGLVPDQIVGNLIYESNPYGESGDAIWSKITAHYDDLFDLEWLEGRAIYKDVLLDSYLGIGLGATFLDDTWLGMYYMGGHGYELYAEAAYPLGERFVGYGVLEYYSDGKWWDGKVGVVFDDLIHLAVENRKASYIYMIGITQPLD